jgi:hypothetical protein
VGSEAELGLDPVADAGEVSWTAKGGGCHLGDEAGNYSS